MKKQNIKGLTLVEFIIVFFCTCNINFNPSPPQHIPPQMNIQDEMYAWQIKEILYYHGICMQKKMIVIFQILTLLQIQKTQTGYQDQ